MRGKSLPTKQAALKKLRCSSGEKAKDDAPAVRVELPAPLLGGVITVLLLVLWFAAPGVSSCLLATTSSTTRWKCSSSGSTLPKGSA